MCEFFSAIATRDGRLLFTEDDSHETIVTRAGLRDTSQHIRQWVRVEVRPQSTGWGPVKVDETTVPGWWTEDQAAHEARVLGLADRVRPAWAAYQAVRQPAWAAYQAVQQSAWAAYQAVQQSALAAYQAVRQSALAAYQAVEQSALAAYQATLAQMEGYCPAI